MGNVVCYQSAKEADVVCRSIWQNFYDSVVPNINSSGAWFYWLIKLLILSIFYISSIFVGVETTQIFLITVSIPMVVNLIAEGITLFFVLTQRTDVFETKLISFDASMIAINTFAVGSVFYIIFTVFTAYAKRRVKPSVEISLFFVSLLIGMVSTIIDEVSRARYFGFQGLASFSLTVGVNVIHIVASVILKIMICCCTPLGASDPTDAVIHYARSRLFWLLPFSLISTFTMVFQFFSAVADYYMVTAFLQTLPYLLLISCFILTPAYRSTIFCCCANFRYRRRWKTKKVRPIIEHQEDTRNPDKIENSTLVESKRPEPVSVSLQEVNLPATSVPTVHAYEDQTIPPYSPFSNLTLIWGIPSTVFYRDYPLA